MAALGILRVGVPVEAERNKGKLPKICRVHDQKLVVLWMTKDHIKFPSWG